MPDTMSEREFALYVEAAHSTVQARCRAGLMPRSARKDAKGRYRIDPVVGAEEWRTNAPQGVVGDEALRAWREARARHEKAQAERAELDLARERGALVPVEEVREGWARLVNEARNKLLGLPAGLKARIPTLSRADVAVVDDLVRQALEDLAADGGRKEDHE